MEDRIKKELDEYGGGLTIDDLTQEEIEELKEEIKRRDNGDMILDGFFSNPSLLYRKRPKDL